METSTPALEDPRLASMEYSVVRHGRVASLEEAAKARGVRPDQIVKTMVIRVSEDEHVFALVPGDRVIDWPKIRDLLGVRRLTMADADEAKSITGYIPGTITPFGSISRLDVVADEAVTDGKVSIGGGAPGVSLTVLGRDLVNTLDARVADITKESD